MRQLPTVKIITKNGHTDTFINDVPMRYVTGITATWDNTGHHAEVNFSMLANVELDAVSDITEKYRMCIKGQKLTFNPDSSLYIDGEKYKLVKIEGG